MSGPTLARRLAMFASGCREGLPSAVVSDVRGRIMDVIGNALAAHADGGGSGDAAGPDRAVMTVMRSWGGSREASIVGESDLLPAPSAAFVNGTLAHALDFDDTHLPSVLHPSASVVPAALAAAEAGGADGRTLAAAVAAGVEVCDRLGAASYQPALRNSVFFDKGFHATSICGTFGAAVAAGLIWGLDCDGLLAAIGIAASMGAGILEANRTGGTVKRVHCGWAAHAGLTAAALARAGLTGPPTVLEGRFGFLTAFLDGRYDQAVLTDGLGERWELLRTTYKPYPSNHFTHPGIDCALALRASGLDPADIDTIELGVADPALRTIAEPREEKIRPRSPYHAKFSGPFTVATALVGGGGLGVYLDDFTEATLRDPARLALAGKVRCVPDPIATDDFPLRFGAVLRVRTTGGSLLEHRISSSRGGPENPLPPTDLALKFSLNAGRALPRQRVGKLAEMLARFPAAVTATDLLALARAENGTISHGGARP